jgi:Spy/CpxP family protein refolding chaperone
MNRTLKTLLAATCLITAAVSTATAEQNTRHNQPNHCVKGHHQGSHPTGDSLTLGKPPFLHGISLTSEQEDKLFALTHAATPAMREFAKQEKTLHEALRQLSQHTPLDETKLKQIAEKLGNVSKDKTVYRITVDSKVLALLTPEQREQVSKHHARFHEGLDKLQPISTPSAPHRHGVNS